MISARKCRLKKALEHETLRVELNTMTKQKEDLEQIVSTSKSLSVNFQSLMCRLKRRESRSKTSF